MVMRIFRPQILTDEPDMKRLLFIFSILLTNLVWAQSEKIESELDLAESFYPENPSESFFHCAEAEQLAAENGDQSFAGDINLCKARYYVLVAQFDLAGKELANAIEFYTVREDQYNLAIAYNLKSLLVSKLGEDDEARMLQLKSLELSRKIQDYDGMIGSLNNLSLDYMHINEVDSVFYCLEELKKLRPHFLRHDYYFYYQNWGQYWTMKDDYKKALEYYTQALGVSEEEKMTDSKATILVLMATAYRMNGELHFAEKFANESYDFSVENDLLYETNDALLELIQIKKAKGDHKGAFEIVEKQRAVEKEIYDLEKVQKFKQIESQLEIAEKEKQIVESEAALKEEQLKSAKARERNIWLYGIVGLVLLGLSFIVFIYLKTRNLNKTIQAQKEEVELKNARLDEAMTSINDSLEYSQMIQKALLPGVETLNGCFDNYFVLYKPKDIVSGDFYWVTKSDDSIIFAVGDCTGHGVPGAMVSMICHEALNKVVLEDKITKPSQILDEVRKLVVKVFNQNTENLNDGMDIALCKMTKNSIEFAGAHNPVWIVRKIDESQNLNPENYAHIRTREQGDYVLIEIKGDKQPIGKFDHAKAFTNSSYQLEPNDTLYIFSDGYADQFGGDKGKKFKTDNFKKLLTSVQLENMEGQKQYINKVFEEWKGSLEQLDDVCVFGVKV